MALVQGTSECVGNSNSEMNNNRISGSSSVGARLSGNDTTSLLLPPTHCAKQQSEQPRKRSHQVFQSWRSFTSSHPGNDAAAGGSFHGSVLTREGAPVRMRREINLLYAVSLLTGIIIGSGIFVSPVSIVANCGSPGLSLVVWVTSGLLTLAIALSYSELAGMMPAAGGEYNYFKQVIGQLPAFLTAWTMNLVVNPCFYAVLALTTANYLFKPFFPSCDMPQSAIIIFAVWILVSFVALNSVYVRYVARVQTLLAVAKIAALLTIAGAGIMQLVKGNTDNLKHPFEGSTQDPGKIAVAIYTGIFSYGGWQYLFFLIEEVQNPARLVPLSTTLSMLAVITLYFFTNVAYFTVLTPAEMMQSSAVAVDFATRCLGPLAPVIPVFVACSTIGALNGSVLGGSRIYFAAARDGLFPLFLAQIHTTYLTPWGSLMLTCLLSSMYVLLGDPIALIEYLGFTSGLFCTVSLLCVIYLRWTEPERKRPIKVPLAIPIVCVLFLASLLVLGLFQQPYQNGIGLMLILSGVPVYIIFVAWKSKPRIITEKSRAMVLLVQKALLLMSPEHEE